MQTARAVPAQFDRASQHRRAMTAKIAIARKQLGMLEDDYRQILFDTTGRLSATECSEAQLAAVLKVLASKGFRAMPKGGKVVARHPTALKARALWISLYQLGVVHNPAEDALEAFAAKQLGCDKLAWARQSDAFKLIEALKDMGRRAGWAMHDKAGHALGHVGLKESLCAAILKRLKANGVARMDWSLDEAAWKLCGIRTAQEQGWTASDYERLAAELGARLRPHLPGRPGGKETA